MQSAMEEEALPYDESLQRALDVHLNNAGTTNITNASKSSTAQYAGDKESSGVSNGFEDDLEVLAKQKAREI